MSIPFDTQALADTVDSADDNVSMIIIFVNKLVTEITFNAVADSEGVQGARTPLPAPCFLNTLMETK